MKKILLALLVMAVSLLSGIAVARDVYVNGYTRSNGTYVQGYYRTSPDNSVYNNYSTKGNVNPYTGQSGTVNPYSNSYGSSYGSSNSNRGYGSSQGYGSNGYGY